MDVKQTVKIRTGLWLPFLLFLVAAFCFPYLGEGINRQAGDLFFRWRFRLQGSGRLSPYLRLFNLDDNLRREYADPPAERLFFSRFIRNLDNGETRTILWDIILTSRIGESVDGPLVAAVEKSGKTILPFGFVSQAEEMSTGEEPAIPGEVRFFPLLSARGRPLTFSTRNALYPFAELARAARGLGAINTPADSDGVLRRIPLFYATPRGFYPSFLLAGLCHFFRVELAALKIDYHRGIILPGADFRGQKQELVIPVDRQGRMLINFPGPLAASFVSFNPGSLEAFSREEQQGMLQGSIVLAGDVSAMGKDFSRGVFESQYPNSFILASALNTILTGEFLRNTPGYGVALLYLFILVAAWPGWRLSRSPSPWILPTVCAGQGIFLAAGLGALNFLFFLKFHWLPVLFMPLVTCAVLLTGLVLIRLAGFRRNSRAGDFAPAVTEEEPEAELFLPGIKLPAEVDPRVVLINFGIITQRQTETALLLLKGFTYKKIASELCITVDAVARRAQKIYHKCGVRRRFEMIEKVYGITKVPNTAPGGRSP